MRRNKDYENLLARYETVLAQSPEGLAVMSTRESATGPADDEKMLGQIIPQVEGLNPYTDMGVF